ncbi:hypothetical protein GCM10022206_62940 [Streptomyces chiangmaiensis]
MGRIGDAAREPYTAEILRGLSYRPRIPRGDALAHRLARVPRHGPSDPARPTGDEGDPALEPVRRRHPRTVS